jgi:GNAT superfamily N-acetyltransferase
VPEVRTITVDELDRIHEIDVSEEGAAIFVQHGTRLEKVARAHRRSWLTKEDWSGGVRVWQGFIKGGGSALGAFDREKLIGFAVYRSRLSPATDQLAALYIDRSFRRQGVASALLEQVVSLARENGALSLYVSAAPSEVAVSFYLDRGFAPVAEPNPQLFELEPEDVHMNMAIA